MADGEETLAGSGAHSGSPTDVLRRRRRVGVTRLSKASSARGGTSDPERRGADLHAGDEGLPSGLQGVDEPVSLGQNKCRFR
jgi:hypothetical protein